MDANLPDANAGSARQTRLLVQLTELFEDVAGTELQDADPTSGFVELGLDSLALTQVALQLQKTFAVKITFRELMESLSTFERLAMQIDQCCRRIPAHLPRPCLRQLPPRPLPHRSIGIQAMAAAT